MVFRSYRLPLSVSELIRAIVGGADQDSLFGGSDIVIGLGSLKLTFANGDELHIDNFDPDDPLTTCSIDTFAFADRTLSLQEILDIGMDVVGTPEDDLIVGTGMNERINALAGDNTVFAGGGNDVVQVGDGNDTVDAGEGNDTVFGSDGNDSLDGGAGADILAGGVGDDTYTVDDQADEVIEHPAQGIDTVHSSITHTLASDLENLHLTGPQNINATGNELNNTLTGNAGNNVLDGKVGADTTAGGAGDDTYRIDNASDLVIEDIDAGTDSVHSTIGTYTLTGNVENLSLTATANQDGAGNALDNVLTGNVWANGLAACCSVDLTFLPVTFLQSARYARGRSMSLQSSWAPRDKSRCWRHGDPTLEAINDTHWRQAA